MRRFGMGQTVTRVEDPRLLTGRGMYTGDERWTDQACGVVLRSPHAHARITAIDTQAARSMPGVLGVYTAADLDAAGIGEIRCLFTPGTCPRRPVAMTSTPVLARDRVRVSGDAVAFLVADTDAAARDALEHINVEYEPLDVVVDAHSALRGAGAPIWSNAPDNVCFVAELGSREQADDAIAGAARVVRTQVVHNRVVVNSMEGRAALGRYADGRYELLAGTQGVHFVRDQLARDIFKVPPEQVRVLTGDVGGGFGMKSGLYREYVLVLHAARELGVAVQWVAERSSDGFVSDTQGRDQVDEVELAFDEQHRLLGMRVRSVANMGAYLSNYGPGSSTDFQRSVYSGPYRIPALHAEITGTYTNTASIEAYRGAGRPECAYRLERAMDAAARELGVDACELRQRNFITPQQMPYTTATGAVYDSGEFDANLQTALGLAGLHAMDARREEARANGQLRGVGTVYYIEGCGGASSERAEVEFNETGTVTVFIGTQSNGQGHETAYAQLVADQLGMSIEHISVVQGDSDRVEIGGGTSGSRSIPMGAPCCERAAQALVELGRSAAAEHLEVAMDDLEFTSGEYAVPGTDVSVTLTELCAARGALRAGGDFQIDEKTYPNGCHVCEVDVDAQTGQVRLVRYLVVDDFGTVLNPLLLAGQVHGGIAQGAGQALMEHTVYEPQSGQLLSGSFMDYCMPRADDLPMIELHLNESVPCTRNPLGLKGAGEAGTIGAIPVVFSAVVDALDGYETAGLQMPLTAEKVWRAMQVRRTDAAHHSG